MLGEWKFIRAGGRKRDGTEIVSPAVCRHFVLFCLLSTKHIIAARSRCGVALVCFSGFGGRGLDDDEPLERRCMPPIDRHPRQYPRKQNECTEKKEQIVNIITVLCFGLWQSYVLKCGEIIIIIISLLHRICFHPGSVVGGSV